MLFIIKTIAGTITAIVTLLASALAVLSFVGITPFEAAQSIQVFVEVSNQIDIEGLDKISEIIPLLEEYLLQELANN